MGRVELGMSGPSSCLDVELIYTCSKNNHLGNTVAVGSGACTYNWKTDIVFGSRGLWEVLSLLVSREISPYEPSSYTRVFDGDSPAFGVQAWDRERP